MPRTERLIPRSSHVSESLVAKEVREQLQSYHSSLAEAFSLLYYALGQLSLDAWLLLLGVLLLFFSHHFLTSIMVFDAVRLMYWDTIKEWYIEVTREGGLFFAGTPRNGASAVGSRSRRMNDNVLGSSMASSLPTASLPRLSLMVSMTAATTLRWRMGQCMSVALSTADFLNEVAPLDELFPQWFPDEEEEEGEEREDRKKAARSRGNPSSARSMDFLKSFLLERSYFLLAFLISCWLLNLLCLIYSVMMGARLFIHAVLRLAAKQELLPEEMTRDILTAQMLPPASGLQHSLQSHLVKEYSPSPKTIIQNLSSVTAAGTLSETLEKMKENAVTSSSFPVGEEVVGMRDRIHGSGDKLVASPRCREPSHSPARPPRRSRKSRSRERVPELYSSGQVQLMIGVIGACGLLFQLHNYNAGIPLVLLPLLLPIQIFDKILTVVT